ncbi:MAG: hypothetical protein ACRETC_10055 [Gammaproteobacteria bacterium]
MHDLTSLLILLAIEIAFNALVVMLAARIVKAGKTGFGAAILAVFLQLCLSVFIHLFVTSPVLAFLIAIGLGSVIYAFVLDTSYPRGLAIGVLVVVFFIIIAVILIGAFGQFAALHGSFG